MLLDEIKQYLTNIQDPGERLSGLRFLHFLEKTPRPFHRETIEGHVTASACIVSSDCQSIALLHHAKLGKWLQPGGHCDGNSNTLQVALKEAQEETGLTNLMAYPSIWDLDVHWIPARKEIPGHWHYDVRYLLGATSGHEKLIQNQESNALLWVPGSQLHQYTQESSIRRMWEKLGKENVATNRA